MNWLRIWPQSSQQKKAFGILSLIIGVAAIAFSIGMVVTGKAGVRGHANVAVTLQNDPSGFWACVGIVFASGVVTLVTGIRAHSKASDDDTH